ncbi:MAG: radical SAM protein [Myxococcales bacterium]|nr:radical SAM protein [Myxococcales bacterium]
MRVRVESFGAIAALEEPPALVWLDRDAAREVAGDHPQLWSEPAGWRLSAPTEIHLMTTNRCPAGCAGCYTSATPRAADAPLADVVAVLDAAAAAGVFHVALGGGESLLRPDLFEIADHARAIGLVPNLTTSGLGMTPGLAERCRVFGQVNVSLDGLGDTYTRSRGYDGAEQALAALRLLRSAGVPAGANFVVSAITIDSIEQTAAALEDVGANELEVLRFKPAGRGRDVYEERRLSAAQAEGLLDRLLGVASRHPSVVIKVDCSLVPLLCASQPDPAALDAFGIFGCEAGNALAAVSHELELLPCSFLGATKTAPTAALHSADRWSSEPTLARFAGWHVQPPEPCASCRYRALCKGGCRAVAAHVCGDAFAPDPECPRVVAHQQQAAR